MAQALLFPDPRPLDRRLGREFFLRAPRRPGVYLMRDAEDRVVYVGKAKNLKQRLGNYRLANPDRMPRRHLRMVRDVARIEFQFCLNESAALRRESKLLRSLKPKFNRAGVWPGRAAFMVWRLDGSNLELGVAEVPESGWRRAGPFNGAARHLHHSLSRLLWLAVNPGGAIIHLPQGWMKGALPQVTVIRCGNDAAGIMAFVEQYFWEQKNSLGAWLDLRLGEQSHPFDRAVVEADLERIRDFLEKTAEKLPADRQLSLL